MHPLPYSINNKKGLTSRGFCKCEVICSQIHDMSHLALTLMFPFSDHAVKKRGFVHAHVACYKTLCIACFSPAAFFFIRGILDDVLTGVKKVLPS